MNRPKPPNYVSNLKANLNCLNNFWNGKYYSENYSKYAIVLVYRREVI